MRKHFHNNKWSALIITIMIVMILTIVMIYLLEKIVPASKNVKWIENSNIAYYNWDAAQEQAFLYLRTSTPWTETWVTKSSTQPRGYDMKITASWSMIPVPWEWNSDFDSNWNIIWPWDPVQFVINNGIDWSQIKFYFKVPNMKLWTTITLSWWTTTPIINWSLSWSGKTIFASGTQIMASNTEIFDSTSSWVLSPALYTRIWADLDDVWWTFADFYTWANAFTWIWLWSAWSVCSWYNCTLKLSVVNDLVSTNNETIPYLEYKIDMWTNTSMPLQYAIIKTDWYSYWFKKSIKREKLQTTSDAIWDFTVFQ